MSINQMVQFPISVQFENGEVESYSTIEELETNLEDFDSDVDQGCLVHDKCGRPVRLKLRLLTLTQLDFA